MNKKIKFRVYNTKSKLWVHGPKCEVNLFGETILLGGFMRNVSILDLNDCVALQYIGLIDLKQNEIYDGDIIKLEGSPYIYEVVWNKWQWGIDSKGVVTDFIQGFTSAVQDRAIIIGNIYDNPDYINI
jgi:hypothetical protein